MNFFELAEYIKVYGGCAFMAALVTLIYLFNQAIGIFILAFLVMASGAEWNMFKERIERGKHE